MTIPMQMPTTPQLATALRPAPSLAMLLQPGQVLDAKVLGAGSAGTTRVELAGKLLRLVLPQPVAVGATLKLAVEAVTPQVRLVVQPQGNAQAAGAHPAPPPTPAAAAVPAPLLLDTAPDVALPMAPSSATTPVAAGPNGTAPLQPQGAVLVAGAAPQASAGTPTAPVQGPVATTTSPPTNTSPPVPAGTAQQPTPASVQPSVGSAAAPAQATTSTSPATSGLAGQATVVAGAPQTAVLQSSANLPPTAAPNVFSRPTGSVYPTAAPTPSAPAAAPAPAATPELALSQMVQSALPRQGPATALTAVLTGLVGRAGVPEPVVRAAQQVLVGRVELAPGKLDGQTLRTAIGQSGVFSEARLGAMPAKGAPADAKTALLALRETLTRWLGSQQPLAAPAPVPPPLRGVTPRAKLADPQPVPLDPALPVADIGRQALERTESTLARVRLHQHAGLPDAEGRPAPAVSMDLPVLVAGYQAILHIQIRQDAGEQQSRPEERGWQMRFAINLPGLGEVGAQVSLRGGAAGVMLWAPEEATAAALEGDLDLLRAGLLAAGVRPASLFVRHGEPSHAAAAQPSDHLLDAVR